MCIFISVLYSLVPLLRPSVPRANNEQRQHHGQHTVQINSVSCQRPILYTSVLMWGMQAVKWLAQFAIWASGQRADWGSAAVQLQGSGQRPAPHSNAYSNRADLSLRIVVCICCDSCRII